MQPHVSIDCYGVKHNFSESKKYWCFYFFAEKPSRTKYQDLSRKSQFHKIALTKIKLFNTTWVDTIQFRLRQITINERVNASLKVAASHLQPSE